MSVHRHVARVVTVPPLGPGFVGPGHLAAIVSVVSDRPQDPAAYKRRIARLRGLSHVTVEVHACPDHDKRAA